MLNPDIKLEGTVGSTGSKVRRVGTGFSPYINPAQHEAFRP
jgi:hypothetical protein